MKRILVVEDNETNMYLVGFILKNNGYEVIEANTGQKGIELSQKENPDLIIMDIQLPDIDGHEVTMKIREMETGKDVPIIAFTSYAMVGDKEKAIEAGCTGYIEKPINIEVFMAEIKKHLP